MEINFIEIENNSKKNNEKENLEKYHNEDEYLNKEYLDRYQLIENINSEEFSDYTYEKLNTDYITWNDNINLLDNYNNHQIYNNFNLFGLDIDQPNQPKEIKNEDEKKKQKPGRKKNIAINKYSQNHSRNNSDNCRVKIKCHFNNFIIDFFNKLIKKKFNKQIYKFRKLPYDISKNVSKKYNKKLLNTKIKEILTKEISGKYKNIDPLQNINTFNKSKFLISEYNELLEMKYEEFYQKIYLPDNNYDEIKNKYDLDKNTIKGNLKQIFNNLETKNQLNEEYKNKILNVAKNEFIDYFLSNKNLMYK